MWYKTFHAVGKILKAEKAAAALSTMAISESNLPV
jgi:hypothetical protein